MAINYNSLKKITGAGIITKSVLTADLADATVQTDQIATDAITNAKIQDLQVTSDKLAASSVNLTSTVVSGTLGYGKGGVGITSLTANKAVKVNNATNALTLDDADLVSCQVWTGNGTWTRPAGIRKVRVQVVGGGGGGSGHGEAGGAGGYAERILDVTGISSVSVTVGGAGGGTWYHNVGGGGGSSSFGPYVSAGGGEGGRNVGGHTGGRPGVGSGPHLNIYGGGGSGHNHHGGGSGGSSYWGGPAIGVHHNGPHTYDWEGHAAQGAGGTGAAQGHGRGAYGKEGMIVVWEYK